MASDPIQALFLARLKTAMTLTAGSDYWHTIPADSVVVGLPNDGALPTGPVAWIAWQGTDLDSGPGLLTSYQATTTISIGMQAPAERTSGNTDAEARWIQCARMVQDIQVAVLNAWAAGGGLQSDGVILMPSVQALNPDGVTGSIEGIASVEVVITLVHRWGVR